MFENKQLLLRSGGVFYTEHRTPLLCPDTSMDPDGFDDDVSQSCNNNNPMFAIRAAHFQQRHTLCSRQDQLLLVDFRLLPDGIN